MGKIGRVAVARFCTHFLFKQFSDFLPFYVYGGEDDVARPDMHQLDNPFPEVAFHCLDSVFFEERVESAFFGQHGFAFYEKPGLMFLKYFEDCFPVFLSIRGPMYHRSVCCGVFLEFRQQFGQMAV